jgi:hypothetical protein
VKDGRPIEVEEASLNLQVRRAPFARVNRTRSRQALHWLGWLLPSALLVAASRQRGRFAVPAATALVTGSLAAAAAVIVHRRRCAREAQIDERLEQTFPASDPASV